MRRALVLLAAAALLAAAGPAGKKSTNARAPDSLAPLVDKAVRQYVRDQIEEEGSFTLEDDVLGRAWDAKLIEVRIAGLRRHPGGQVSVCVDFKGEDEKRSQPMDVDFVLSEGDGEWVVDEVLIHSVGKTPRFTYGPKNERVPAKAGKKAGKGRPPVPAGEPGE